MKTYRKIGKSGNAIATLAIGEKYVEEWEKYSFKTWIQYCEKYDLGLYVLDESVEEDTGKRYDWHKLLIGAELSKLSKDINNVCFLDVDVLINPYAPNVFEQYDSSKIAMVSEIKNLPFNLIEVQERIAFFRNNYLSNKYPLDSYLFATPEQIFELHSLERFDDYGCGGMFIFNQKHHADLLKEWYYLYDKNSNFLANPGEEVYLNYHIQKHRQIQWLPYKWQALWIYEVAWNHSHLYLKDDKENAIISRCIETSLFNNYFLHFAGSWEKWAWCKTDKLFEGIRGDVFERFQNYSKIKKTGQPVGQILPSN